MLLTLLPALASIVLSFTQWDGLKWGELRWVGADNYAGLLGFERGVPLKSHDPWYFAALPSRPKAPLFYQALYNTLLYSVAAVPSTLTVALLLALLLDVKLRGIVFFRSLYYLPHVLSGVATVMVWSWLFNPKFGWVNAGIRSLYKILDPILRTLGFGGTAAWPVPDWFYSPAGCKPALVIMHVWTAGGAMLIFLAALQTVPAGLYEATAIDGAGRWRRFWNVTLPQITPALNFNLITGMVYSLQTFSEAYLLQNRAQRDGLLFYVVYLYQSAFEEPHRLGYACALAWVMSGLIMLLALLAWRWGRWWVYYECDGVP